MKRLKYVLFSIPENKKTTVKEILRYFELDIPPVFTGEKSEVLSTSHVVILPEDSEQLHALLQKLKELKIDDDPFIRDERSYTKKEMSEASLFWIHANKQPDDGYNVYGTSFNDSEICSVCGSGVRQKSDLILQISAFKKTHFAATFNFEYIISADLAKAIQKDFKGFKLLPIIDNKTKKGKDKLYQFWPTEKLPPLMPPTVLHKGSSYCSNCGKNGLFIYSEMHIEERPKKNVDAYFTQEIFGEMRTRGCPGPELVLSKKLIDKIKEFDERALRIEPVFLGNKVFRWDEK